MLGEMFQQFSIVALCGEFLVGALLSFRPALGLFDAPHFSVRIDGRRFGCEMPVLQEFQSIPDPFLEFSVVSIALTCVALANEVEEFRIVAPGRG